MATTGPEQWKPGVLTKAATCLCCKSTLKAGVPMRYSGVFPERHFICSSCGEQLDKNPGPLNLLTRWKEA